MSKDKTKNTKLPPLTSGRAVIGGIRSIAAPKHPDAWLFFACNELATIRHDSQAFIFDGWQETMRSDLLSRDAITVEGSWIRMHAIENEWPDVYSRPCDASIRPQDEA